MAFPGVRKAVAAMGMGGVVEQDAFNDEGRRLTAARSASALMDRRVSDANIAGRKDVAGGQLNDMLDMSDPANVAIIAELASQFNSAQTAKGTRQENELQGGLIDQFNENPDDFDPKIANAVQAIVGKGAFTTGKHIDPGADALADREYVTSLTNAADARAEASRSSKSSLGSSKLSDDDVFNIFGNFYQMFFGWLMIWIKIAD